MEKILFTGGTHVGKTSVLEYLESEGYSRFVSVAGANMMMLHDLLGVKRYSDYRNENFKEFQISNIYDDAKLYHKCLSIKNAKSHKIFFDRGVFDWIASLKREGIIVPDSINELVGKIKYNKIFIFDPISEHNTREQTARLLDRETSEKWADYIEKEYGDRGNIIIHVPDFKAKTPAEAIKKRAQFVLDNVEMF